MLEVSWNGPGGRLFTLGIRWSGAFHLSGAAGSQVLVISEGQSVLGPFAARTFEKGAVVGPPTRGGGRVSYSDPAIGTW